MDIRKTMSAVVAIATTTASFGLALSTHTETAEAASAWRQEGVAWMAPSTGGIEVYRLSDPATGLHHYTVDANERKALSTRHGWKYEGVAFRADTKGQPVYRIYNSQNKKHNYTLDTHERDVLTGKGWKYEGIAWYVSSSANLPVYRAFNQSNGEHLWTVDANEYETLGKASATPTALSVLEQLTVNDRLASGYNRDLFGESWADTDGNGCGTRDDILTRDLTNVVKKDSCRVASGILHDPYTGTTINFVRGSDTDNDGGVQIDHVVALSNAWKSGANTWTDQQRLMYANDPYVLLAVDDQANEDKRDYAADKWLPSNTQYRCAYVARQIGIKSKYKLNVTTAERDAMRNVLTSCPGQSVPAGVGSPFNPTQTTSKPSPSKPSSKPNTSKPSAPKPSTKPQTGTQKKVTPGAFCSPRGATGIGKKNGKVYTCKPDNAGRLRWRR
ncbi:DUF1524 domain-containing protein [Bifidobacterium amazonense]|uniref:DUF1524 domain-containing protein n=1 Tax=Bifidobacterium amazonense TaxID=2809027 RepID=A0ABS9VYM1_9BIFI|nr:DUF1524 domain-containing protein [Bifidobacterium amazonense]MCH9277026.1 DUF1524 domain-containing protein [Bifidobacterium amazonense]